jgi:hypothetical protein
MELKHPAGHRGRRSRKAPRRLPTFRVLMSTQGFGIDRRHHTPDHWDAGNSEPPATSPPTPASHPSPGVPGPPSGEIPARSGNKQLKMHSSYIRVDPPPATAPYARPTTPVNAPKGRSPTQRYLPGTPPLRRHTRDAPERGHYRTQKHRNHLTKSIGHVPGSPRRRSAAAHRRPEKWGPHWNCLAKLLA